MFFARSNRLARWERGEREPTGRRAKGLRADEPVFASDSRRRRESDACNKQPRGQRNHEEHKPDRLFQVLWQRFPFFVLDDCDDRVIERGGKALREVRLRKQLG